MSSRKKRGSAVKWDRFSFDVNRNEKEHLLVRALWEFFAVSFLVMSGMLMTKVILGFSGVSVRSWMTVEASIAVLILIFDVGFPLLEEKHLFGLDSRLIRTLVYIVAIVLVLNIFLHHHLVNINDYKYGELTVAEKFMEPFNRIMKQSIYVEKVRGDAKYIQPLVYNAIRFWSLFLFTVIFLISRLFRKNWFVILFPALAASALMMIGLAPAWNELLMFAVGTYMVLGMGRHMQNLPACVGGLALFVLVLLFSGLVFKHGADSLLSKSDRFKELQEEIELKIHNLMEGISVSEQRDINNSMPRYSDVEILTIVAENKPSTNLYLREYYGNDYENGTWNSDRDRFEKKCKIAGFDLSQAYSLLDGSLFRYKRFAIETDYTIKYGKKKTKAALFPYTVQYNSSKKVEYTGDTLILKKGNDKKISFTALDVNTYEIDDFRSLLRTSGRSMYDDTFWDWYNAYVDKNYSDNLTQKLKTVELLTAYGRAVGDSETYSDIEEKYLEEYWRSLNASDNYNNLNRYVYAMIVKEYLAENYTYSWNLDSLKAGEDPIEYFLSEGKQGYCVHFASAAVALLRAEGIPARYVGGYVVKPAAFKRDGKEYTAKVTDRNGHAWVEIYFENIGWLPFEMTPGYDKNEEGLPTSEEEQERREAILSGIPTSAPETSDTPTPSPEATDTPTPAPTGSTNTPTQKPTQAEITQKPGSTATPTPASKDRNEKNLKNQDKKATKSAILFIILALLCVAAVALMPSLIRKIRRKLFASKRELEIDISAKRYRKAILNINRRVYKKLKIFRKVPLRDIKDSEYERCLKLGFPSINIPDWNRYMETVKKAAFSQEELTEEDMNFVKSIYIRIDKNKL